MKENIRMPAVSGQWYPANPDSLRSMVMGFLDNAKIEPNIKGQLIGIISPHAGYVYSGSVAGYSFKYIQNNKDKFTGKTFILIGPSHHSDFNGIAIYKDGSFQTPLGNVPVDTEIAEEIMADTVLVRDLKEPHISEHSLESQLPFLQVALDNNFKIVPILFGRVDLDDIIMFGEILSKVVRENNAIIVASTDMSHYHPYKVANDMDAKGISAVQNLDIEKLVNGLESGQIEYCGYSDVIALMRAARLLGVEKGLVLKYANSGDVSFGDKDRVVGYTSILFLTDKIEKQKESNTEFNLKIEQKKYLLGLARKSIETYLKTGKKLSIEPPDDKVLKSDGAVFVTLNEKKQLRGCIGQMIAQGPLYKAVIDMAVSSAVNDYRFQKVTLDELKDIEIEISVLSPMKKIDDWKKIKLGEHGVYLKNGNRSGVFLPQVGKMPGFTLTSFLEELCEQKAGLPREAYKDPKTELYIFTVLEFDETHIKK